jgi:hypothetical protein
MAAPIWSGGKQGRGRTARLELPSALPSASFGSFCAAPLMSPWPPSWPQANRGSPGSRARSGPVWLATPLPYGLFHPLHLTGLPGALGTPYKCVIPPHYPTATGCAGGNNLTNLTYFIPFQRNSTGVTIDGRQLIWMDEQPPDGEPNSFIFP